MIDKQSFLDGKIGIEICDEVQENFIVELAINLQLGEGNNFKEIRENIVKTFPAKTYLKYPYWYIENGEFLQASMFQDYDECESFILFDDIFQLI